MNRAGSYSNLDVGTGRSHALHFCGIPLLRKERAGMGHPTFVMNRGSGTRSSVWRDGTIPRFTLLWNPTPAQRTRRNGAPGLLASHSSQSKGHPESVLSVIAILRHLIRR